MLPQLHHPQRSQPQKSDEKVPLKTDTNLKERQDHFDGEWKIFAHGNGWFEARRGLLALHGSTQNGEGSGVDVLVPRNLST